MNGHARIRRVVAALGTSMSIAGCLPVPIPAALSEVDAPMDAMAPLAIGEAVVILGAVPGVADDDHPECAYDAMLDAAPNLRAIAAPDFREALDPWFAPGKSLADSARIAALLAEPEVRDRLTLLDVRYLALVGRGTLTGEFGGPHLIIIGVMGGTDTYELTAALWDAQEARHLGDVNIAASGHGMLATYGFFNVVVWPMVQTGACEGLGRTLAALMTGDALPTVEDVVENDTADRIPR